MTDQAQPQERDDLIERLEALSRRDHDDLSVADEAIIEIRWLKSEITRLRAQPSPREVTLEKVLRLLEDERQGYENCSSSGDYYTRGTNIAKEAALHEAIRRVHALSQASDGWEG